MARGRLSTRCLGHKFPLKEKVKKPNCPTRQLLRLSIDQLKIHYDRFMIGRIFAINIVLHLLIVEGFDVTFVQNPIDSLARLSAVFQQKGAV